MPVPPGLSQKDADQVLRAVMDDNTNRLRVDAVISPSGHDLEINYQDDSIAIGDPASDNILAIQSDGSIKVDIQDTSLEVTQGTAPWIVSGSVTTSPDVNIHDSSGNSLSSTGTSLNVDVTNTVPVLQSGAWTVTANAGTNLNTSLLALDSTLTNKSQFTKITDGTDTALVTGSGELNVLSTAQPGVDIGDVTVNNSAGASAVNIQDGGNSLTVDGTVTAVQLTGSNLHVEVDSGTIIANQGGTWNINNISGAISLPTGAATSALQTTGNTSLASIDSKLNSLGQKTMANSVPIVIASDQSAVPISGSITVSGTISSFNFPSTVDTNYGTVGASTIRTAAEIGNATGVAAFNAGTTTAQTIRVVLPTDQTAIPATQSGTWNINNVSGTVSLPTGASTSALQTTGNTSLSSIDGKVPALGQAAMAASTPVTIASNQSAIPASQSGTWTVQPGNTANTTAWKVDGSAVTQPVSGTVTVNAGTNLNTSLLALDTTLTNKTQFTKLTDGTDTGLITAAGELNVLATAQPGVDIGDVTINNASGAAAVNIQDGGNSITVDGTITVNPLTNVSIVKAQLQDNAGNALNSTSNALNVSVQNTTLAVTQSGTWTVQPGNTANTTPWLTTINQGGNSAAVSASNALKVDGSAVTQPVSGTVTANAGTNLNTSLLALESGGNLASIKTNTDNLNLAQASTTSGQKGNLILGAVTTAAPTYTTAQSNPLSLTTAGALRTDSSATTQPVSGTLAATQSGTWNIGTVTPGTAATNLGKAEDAGHTTGDVGVFALGVRNDANASLTSTDLDYSPIATDIAGRLKVVQESSVKTTYGSAISGLVTAATATDVFTLTGSSTKTIKIIEMGMSGTASAAVSVPISLIKRSTANTSGTSTSPAVVPYDSTNAAGTAVARAYTANPTLGNTVGSIKTHKILIDSTTIASNFIIYQHGATPNQPIVLRGTAEVLAINFNSTTITTPLMSLYIIWTEE